MTAGAAAPPASASAALEEAPAGPSRPLPDRAWRNRVIESVDPGNFIPQETIPTIWTLDIEEVSPLDWFSGEQLRTASAREDEGVVNFSGRTDEGEALTFTFDIDPISSKIVPPTADRPPVTRILQANAPQDVRLGQRFAISVQLLMERAASGAQTELRAFDVPAYGRKVFIDVHLCAGLRVLSDATRTLQAMIKRRSAIKPAIGHMKIDERLGRNPLKGVLGDALHAVLCGAGHNLRLILAALRLYCARLGLSMQAIIVALIADPVEYQPACG